LWPITAWDFRGAEQMWSNYNSFRAIENGLVMFRVVKEGLTLAVNHHGHPLVQSNYFVNDQPIVYADLPTEGVDTLYSLLGDWFAWLSIAGFVLLLVIVIARRISKAKQLAKPD